MIALLCGDKYELHSVISTLSTTNRKRVCVIESFEDCKSTTFDEIWLKGKLSARDGAWILFRLCLTSSVPDAVIRFL